jgi:hypothetical protein
MEGLIEETNFRRNLDIEMGAVSETDGIGDGVVNTIEELTGTNFKEITGGHFIFVSAN